MRHGENLSMIKLMGLWHSLSQSMEEISLRGRMADVSIIDLCHNRHKVENLDQMQKMWNAIIVTRMGTTKNFAG
jgi:hypothetical protein